VTCRTRLQLALLGAPQLLLALTGLLFGARAAALDPIAAVDAQEARALALSRQLWDWAELGFLEVQSSALLRDELAGAGFRIEAGVAGLPTAFIASSGHGQPVIALLAEFDALPGLSQSAVPERRPRAERDASHACGHNLFGAGSTVAAIAVARWLADSGTPGTVRLYGTPAEEGGSGKVYLARAGLFDDVDVALHWHPSDRNDASAVANLANKSAKFRFHGVSSHAAVAPERGRSALDGVEAMNDMVNMLREHVPEATRIHYVITHGGLAPNVVPEFAEVFYYVRHPDPRVLLEVWQRVEAAAEGAALGTGTRVDHEVIHGNLSLLPNETLARVVDEALHRVGGPVWNAEARAFAERLRESLPDDAPPLASAFELQPLEARLWKASSDVGDVSWTVPTAGLKTATWVPGTTSHSWQAAATSGSPVGEAGMWVAARTLALTAVALFQDPGRLAAARAEFEQRRGPDFHYQPLLGERAPPLDYRR
jgi:aminobenzoyl-glutamate utilization protein B